MSNISELKFDDQNFNDHTEQGMSLLEKSLRENGAGRSILIDKDNNIIAGNGIIEAAGSIGLENMQIVETTGDKIIAVKRTDVSLNSEKGRQMALADNASAAADLSWNKENLGKHFTPDDLKVWNIDLDWDDKTEIQEDESPEVDESEPAKSELGKVYHLGEHRLMCGDSTDAGSMAILMDGQKADMVFTDPPYNADYSSRVDKTRRKPWGGILNDNMTHEAFENFLIDINSVLYANMEDGASIYECMDWKHYSQLERSFREAFDQKSMIVWNKNYFGLGTYYRTKHELILFGVKGDKVNVWNAGHDEMDVWSEDREKVNNYQHPTQKPLSIPMRAIKNSSNNNDLVLDIFGGSGSTLIACEQLGRKCYMMELDPKYCDVIRKRYWKFKTGSEEGWEDGTAGIC